MSCCIVSLGHLAFEGSRWELLLMTMNIAITLMVRFLHSASTSSNSRLLSHLYFLYSCMSHQGTGELKICFTALQVHYLQTSLLYHAMVPFLLNYGYFVLTQGAIQSPPILMHRKSNTSPFCGPERGISFLRVSTSLPKYISKLLQAPKWFWFPEWQKLPLC